MTQAARKKAAQVTLVLQQEGEKADDDENEAKPENEKVAPKRPARNNAVLTDRLRNEASTEERRKRHQQELAGQLNDRALERLNKNKGAVSEPRLRKSNIAYKNINNFPNANEDEVRELKIYVDRKNETVVSFPCTDLEKKLLQLRFTF